MVLLPNSQLRHSSSRPRHLRLPPARNEQESCGRDNCTTRSNPQRRAETPRAITHHWRFRCERPNDIRVGRRFPSHRDRDQRVKVLHISAAYAYISHKNLPRTRLSRERQSTKPFPKRGQSWWARNALKRLRAGNELHPRPNRKAHSQGEQSTIESTDSTAKDPQPFLRFQPPGVPGVHRREDEAAQRGERRPVQSDGAFADHDVRRSVRVAAGRGRNRHGGRAEVICQHTRDEPGERGSKREYLDVLIPQAQGIRGRGVLGESDERGRNRKKRGEDGPNGRDDCLGLLVSWQRTTGEDS